MKYIGYQNFKSDGKENSGKIDDSAGIEAIEHNNRLSMIFFYTEKGRDEPDLVAWNFYYRNKSLIDENNFWDYKLDSQGFRILASRVKKTDDSKLKKIFGGAGVAWTDFQTNMIQTR